MWFTSIRLTDIPQLSEYLLKVPAVDDNNMSGRDKWTEVGRVLSEARLVSCGIPQGGVQGPLLFCQMKFTCFKSLCLYDYSYMIKPFSYHANTNI